ncbi:MAG: hypothetical protein KBT28_04360 [Bacteroidales bacterium]|nr:hypothetical protein [Candidatus Colimorpha merdihippi]
MMKRFLLFLAIMATLCGTISAQNKKLPADAKTAQINIPGWCCNSLNPTIENTLAYERGVVSWTLDKEHKRVNVVYRSKKTNPDRIEKSLSDNGVRTEHYAANPRAIKDLPKCCQPANRGEQSSCGH